MGRVFETLNGLGEYIASTGIEVVDPGVPLNEWNADANYGPAWRNQPSVRKVVGFAARNIASTSLHAFERSDDDGRDRLRDGDLAALLRRPSRAKGLTPYRFWEQLLIDGLLHDKYCARIVLHEDGPELVRIPARRVRFTNDGLDRIDKVLITASDGRQREEDPADFLIDVGYSERGVNGTSPLRTLRQLLDEYTESVAYRRSVWKNGARIPAAISRPKPFTNDAARNRFTRNWQTFTGNGGNAGGTPIFEDGEQFVKIDSFKPRDTNDLEGRRLTDIEVASAYYIAPELVGAREGTFANIQAFKEMLFGPNLGPYIVAWEQALNAELVHRFAPGRDVYIEANVEGKLRGSFEQEASVLSTAAGAPWMTRNEVRSRKNLPAIDGGDEIVTPLNVLIGGQASPQDGKTAGGGGGALPKSAEELQRLVLSATALIRAGFSPQAASAACGLNPIEHLGLLPVTLQDDEEPKAGSVLAKFRSRQRQVVRSQKSADVAEWWDARRWDRELTDDLIKAGADYPHALTAAHTANNETERQLRTEGGTA